MPLYQLATFCLRHGRRDEAVEYLRAYLKGDPANDGCTEWARNIIRQLCPAPLLVWSKGEQSSFQHIDRNSVFLAYHLGTNT